MFGLKPKAGMFGAPSPIGTPPIAPPMDMGAGMASRPQGGFNAPGGWADKLGMLGDLLTGNQVFTPQIRARQQQEIAEQQYQRRQQDEQATWLARQQWQRENPAPVNNDTVNDYEFIKQTRGEVAANQYLDNVSAGPPMAVDAIDPVTGNTVRQYVPRQSLPGMGQPQAAPQGQILQQLPPGVKPIGPGGAGPQAPGRFPSPMSAPGTMTSGRRTAAGNALVGGVPNSYHLSGDAADYTGATPAQLRAYFGPGVKIIPEGDHNHVQGRGLNAPFFGRRGTTGLRR